MRGMMAVNDEVVVTSRYDRTGRLRRTGKIALLLIRFKLFRSLPLSRCRQLLCLDRFLTMGVKLNGKCTHPLPRVAVGQNFVRSISNIEINGFLQIFEF